MTRAITSWCCALADFVAEQGSTKPLHEQAELFRLATGLDEALYTYLGATNLEAPEGCTLSVEGSELSIFIATRPQTAARAMNSM